MADDIRELLRAAQKAEIQGESARAVAYLERVAAIYERFGKRERALQMLRHAARLDSSRPGLAEAIGRLESKPAQPDQSETLPVEEGVSVEVLEETLQRSISVLEWTKASSGPMALVQGGRQEGSPSEGIEGESGRVGAGGFEDGESGTPLSLVKRETPVSPEGETEWRGEGEDPVVGQEEGAGVPAGRFPPRNKRLSRLIERGPVLADSSIDAWCSFCCRPRTEVGELVAGPAGAFICSGCVRESARLLGEETRSEEAQVSAPTRMAPQVTLPAQALLGQDEAMTALKKALALGRRWILLVGPEGCGKTTCLRELERQGVGSYALASDALPSVVGEEVLLLDGLDALPPAEAVQVCERAEMLGTVVVVAVRGALTAPTLLFSGKGSELPVFSTQALVAATQGRLPTAAAEHVQAVIPFQALSAKTLRAVAHQMLSESVLDVVLSDKALDVLVSEVVTSERGGHELRALIARFPPGNWDVTKSSPVKGKPRRKRGR